MLPQPLSTQRHLPSPTMTGTAKRSRSVRLADPGWDRIADRARRADVDVSKMLRRMLAYADAHMPDQWVPPRPAATGKGER